MSSHQYRFLSTEVIIGATYNSLKLERLAIHEDGTVYGIFRCKCNNYINVPVAVVVKFGYVKDCGECSIFTKGYI